MKMNGGTKLFIGAKVSSIKLNTNKYNFIRTTLVTLKDK